MPDSRSRPSRAPAHPSASPSALLDSYRVRIMLTLAVSLALVLLATHLPFHKEPGRVGWLVPSFSERMLIEMPLPEKQKAPAPSEGAPLTVFGATEEVQVEATEQEPPREQEEEAPPADEPPMKIPPMQQLVLENPDQSPKIAGGPGNLYMNIAYPEAARRKGIQGLVVLSFIVERDGHISDVEVTESLHPLCDSSAVRALRQTRFVPGRQNGEPVRVRMRLPVRFKLVNVPDPAEGATAAANASDGTRR